MLDVPMEASARRSTSSRGTGGEFRRTVEIAGALAVVLAVSVACAPKVPSDELTPRETWIGRHTLKALKSAPRIPAEDWTGRSHSDVLAVWGDPAEFWQSPGGEGQVLIYRRNRIGGKGDVPQSYDAPSSASFTGAPGPRLPGEGLFGERDSVLGAQQGGRLSTPLVSAGWRETQNAVAAFHIDKDGRVSSYSIAERFETNALLQPSSPRVD